MVIAALFVLINALPSRTPYFQNWTESHVKFSPKGSYLATCHKQGIALWGGPDFSRVGRFLHPNVTYFQFSPCEKYVLLSYILSKYVVLIHYCRKLNWRCWQELQNPSRSAKKIENPYVREARVHFPTTFLEIHFSVP